MVLDTMKVADQKELLDQKDLGLLYGFSRPMRYALLNRPDLPVIQIGGRKFMHRQLFDEWLRAQASGAKGA